MALPTLLMAGTPINERTDFPSDGRVEVINISGEVEVSAWGEEAVELTGELGSGSKLVFERSGSQLKGEVKVEGRGGFRGPERSDLRLRVPSRVSLELTGVSADLRIEDLEGAAVIAESVSGDVEVRAQTQRLELSSVSGDVDFSGTAERSALESVSGDIRAEGLSGEIEINVVSGDIDLRGGSFSRGRFETVSGTLDLTIAVAPEGRLSVESMSGDVTLNFPAGQQGDFRVQTFSGDVRSDFGTPDREKRGPGTRLQHVEGDGNATIRVENFSGNVRLNQR
jgi:DUF4097 and DUF4098 domain-containing protein YvlB